MIHAVLLLGCAAAIYLACEWFVNAVEWLGVALRMAPLAVGTILAAAGTALPESVVTLVAVTAGNGQRDDIGVGAAMGGPLALATIGYGVTGWMLLRQRRRTPAGTNGDRGLLPLPIGADRGPGQPDADGEPVGEGGMLTALAPAAATATATATASVSASVPASAPLRPAGGPPAAGLADRLARDQAWFLAIFVVKVGLGLVAFSIKPWLGLLFFAAYAMYLRAQLRGGERPAGAEDLDPLRLQPRRARPALWAVLAQTVITLALIFFASQLFVHQLEWAGPALGLPATVVALLLAPVATELPEVMNAIIWVRAGKTDLALANISGAMMIQATVPSGLGLLFTSWRFGPALVLSGIVTMVAIGYLLLTLRAGRFTASRLAVAGGFYAVFALGVAAGMR